MPARFLFSSLSLVLSPISIRADAYVFIPYCSLLLLFARIARLEDAVGLHFSSAFATIFEFGAAEAPDVVPLIYLNILPLARFAAPISRNGSGRCRCGPQAHAFFYCLIKHGRHQDFEG